MKCLSYRSKEITIPNVHSFVIHEYVYEVRNRLKTIHSNVYNVHMKADEN